MEFKQLEAFVRVVKYRSFSKAAEELFLTQPAVSSSISSLEKELDTVLLERTAKETRPTREGRAFYSYALSILNTRDRALCQLGSMEDDISGEIEIRTSSIPAIAILPGIVSGFNRKYPNVTFNIEQTDSKNVFDSIIDGIGEIGFAGSFCKNQLKYIPVLRDNMIIITPDNEKYRAIKEKRGKLKPEDIVNENYVARKEGSATWEAFLDVMGKNLNGQELKVLLTVNSMEQVAALVKEGLGISVVSEIALRGFPQGILSFEFSEEVPEREFYMVYNKDITLSPAAKKFKEYIESQLK